MFPKNHDSDQSLSEEEDLSCEDSEKCAISLSGSPVLDKGRSLQVLSQLEKLRKDAYELEYGINSTISPEERQRALCIEDDIEFPAFNNEGDSVGHLITTSVPDSDEENIHDQRLASICNSDEEIVSDNEKSGPPKVGSVKQYGGRDIWSEANREVEALVQLNENTGPSKVHKSSKDGRSKGKPKFLFCFQTQKKGFHSVVSDKKELGKSLTDLPQNEELESGENGDLQQSMAESFEIFKGREVDQPENYIVPLEGAIYHDRNENSVAEFLDGLQEKSGRLRGTCEMPNRLRRRRTPGGFRRSASPVGDRNMDGDMLLNSRSSTDDEGDSPHPKPFLQPKTMADQFHEALGAASPNNIKSEVKFHGQSGIGLFEKLQHVMLSEKERDMNFLERSNMVASSSDGRSCIDVRILSRSLEAKLTVCTCSLIGDESSQWVDYFHTSKRTGQRILTIIFSSRICGDIELEVGNLIRIQPPWKEVNISEKDEVIILSTYFFQLGSS